VVKKWAENKMEERRREVVDGLVENNAQIETSKRGRQIINWEVEVFAANKVGERGGEGREAAVEAGA
jgi:hypothetical protein